ncbi:hypothetical protein ACFZC6_15340 [Streptomyces ossamyceticus]|uniref:Uncharacterized protein n=1 Tax=Streptomyces ossamyceticus TaxID=249581 RepID=A0ABV2V250_9ACTN
MTDSLRDVMTLTDAPHSVDVESMRQLQKPLLRAPTKAQSTPAFWYVILLPLPRMMWVNMQPVGTFIETPPTLYSKVRTGVDPIAVACAPVELVSTRATRQPLTQQAA